MFFYLSLLWLFGDGFEQAWGSFKLNLYYLLGMAGHDHRRARALGSADAHGRLFEPVADVCLRHAVPELPVLLFFSSRCG